MTLTPYFPLPVHVGTHTAPDLYVGMIVTVVTVLFFGLSDWFD